MSRPKAIIFDFDGVIHDTFDFHLEKIREFTGFNLTPQIYRDMHNGNFFRSVPKELVDVNWEDYRDYVYDLQSSLIIKNEIKYVLHKLGDEFSLFIVTSGGKKNIFDYLQNNGVVDKFTEVLGMEICNSKVRKFELIFEKYKFNSDECLFVTDTLGDIIEANKVGIKTIGVDFGFHDEKTLVKGEPELIISHFDELFNYLSRF